MILSLQTTKVVLKQNYENTTTLYITSHINKSVDFYRYLFNPF